VRDGIEAVRLRGLQYGEAERGDEGEEKGRRGEQDVECDGAREEGEVVAMRLLEDREDRLAGGAPGPGETAAGAGECRGGARAGSLAQDAVGSGSSGCAADSARAPDAARPDP
jgi:hypothetical protein